MAVIYKLKYDNNAASIAEVVKTYLKEKENMEVQMFEMDNKEYLVQGRVKGGKMKQYIGMDKVASVKISDIGNDNVEVEVTKGKWLDKGMAMTVSMFVLWPLFVTSSIGMYKQGTLPGKIQKAVAQCLE